MKKKGIILGGIIAVIIVIMLAIFFIPKVNQRGITKFQLIEKVTEHFSISEYENRTPYFVDVVASSEYFDMVQSAKERGIISEESIFNGDDVIDGRYLVLTAMRAIEKYKIMLYAETIDELTEDEYIKLALEKDIIDKSQLKRGVSEEECELIISKVSELDKHGLWKDDFYEVEYKKDVIEIEKGDAVEVAEDSSQIELSEECADSLQIGTVIMFENPKTGEKIAKQISELTDGNIFILEDVELDVVMESVMISDITAVTSENMFSDNNTAYADVFERSSIKEKEHVTTPVFYSDGSWNGDGFSKELEIGEGTVTINVTDLYVGIQLYGSAFNIQYANVQTEANIDVIGEFTAESEWISPPILKTKAVLAGGVASVDLEFYLVLSAEGSVTIEARMPAQIGVEYADGRLHTPQVDVSMESAEVIANCEAGCYVRTEVVPRLCGMEIIDAEADIGVNVTANVTTRMGEDVWMCADMSINYPIITLMLWGDDDLEPLIKNKENNPKTWEIMNAENTFVKDDMHCEWYVDGTYKIVDECTCGRFVPLGDPHMYTIYFDSEITKKDNHYEATGILTDTVYILESDLKGLSIGEAYIYDGYEFIYKGRVKYDDRFSYYDFVDRNGNEYTVFDGNINTIGNMVFYPISVVTSVNELFGSRETKNIELVLYKDYKFTIVDYTDVWVPTEAYNGKRYDINEIFEKNIKDCEGKSLIHDIKIPIGATFNDNGEVHSMGLRHSTDSRNDTVLVYPF